VFNRSGFLKTRFFASLGPAASIGLFLTVFFVILALIGPLFAPYPYDKILRGEDVGMESRRALIRQSPSAQFPFGTDQRGRDILSRMLYGARETIGLPLLASGLAVLLGSALGMYIGYKGGLIDSIVSRFFDSLLSIPAIVLALVAISTLVPLLSQQENLFGIDPRNISLLIIIVLLYLPVVARVARSAVMSHRTSGFVEQAALRAESSWYIISKELLPLVLPSLVVESALRLSYSIILVTSLGFLGLGIQPPAAEWGRMVLDARSRMLTEPWELWIPAAAIVILIISVNLLSDGLKRYFRSEEL
jgi:peptide/nickel transport system permease protein